MKTYQTIALAFLIFACGQRNEMANKDAFQESLALPAPSEVSLAKAEQEQESEPIQTERKLIKNGSLSMETSSTKKAKAEIEKICKEMKAYISSENQFNYEDRLQFNTVIRVPANHFDELTSKVEALASHVESKNISTDDVTEEFIDIEARLKTKKELETRYREILKQAHTVTDILAIESQIGSVRSEIESMEGRLKYLKNQVSFSTLTLTFYEHIGSNFGFGSKFGLALKNGWDNLLYFLIGLTNLWPFVLLMAAGAYAGWRKFRKSKKITDEKVS